MRGLLLGVSAIDVTVLAAGAGLFGLDAGSLARTAPRTEF